MSGQQYDFFQCRDLCLLKDGPLSLRCTSFTGVNVLSVEPEVVMQGEPFTVRSSFQTPLPERINCTITSTMTGEVIQWNVLNVSGTAPLYVKEKYYALELVSCDEEVYIE